MDNGDKATVQPSPVRGFTLVETLIAIVVFVVLSTILWQFLVQGRRSEANLQGGFSAQQDMMLAMQRLTRELQEAGNVFFPLVEDAPREGIGFTSARGTPILYYVRHGADPNTPGTLYRSDLASGKQELLARSVNYFKVTLAGPAEGKKVSLVNLNLSILRGTRDVTGKRDDYSLITEVFLRNLKVDVP